MAGYNDKDSIWLATVPAFGNFIFTIFGLFLVDRIGRRKLLIGTLVGVVFGLLLLSGSFVVFVKATPPATPLYDNECDYFSCGACVGNSNCGYCTFDDSSDTSGTCSSGNKTSSCYLIDGHCQIYNDNYTINGTTNSTTKWHYNDCPLFHYAWLTILSLFVYIMFFAPGMGPLPWTVNSEIYPNWARSTCIAIATSVNWIFNLVVSLTFLTLSDALGQPGTFGLYAGLALLALLFVIAFLPETKDRRLEDMEMLFQRPYFTYCCSNTRNINTSIN